MSINWKFISDNLPLYEKAAGLTVKLALWGILLSLLIGLVCSLVLYFKIKVINKVVKVYIELSRNTPLLIQLFFLYYGFPKIGITMSGTTCAVVGLSFLGGSYMAESFRSGIEATGKSQIESGLSIGLSKVQLGRYIILPQAFSVSLPSIGANCIFLIKETSLVGAISIMDLMNVTKDLIGMYYQTFESLLMLTVSYLILILPVSIFLTWLERKVRYAEFGN